MRRQIRHLLIYKKWDSLAYMMHLISGSCRRLRFSLWGNCNTLFTQSKDWQSCSLWKWPSKECSFGSGPIKSAMVSPLHAKHATSKSPPWEFCICRLRQTLIVFRSFWTCLWLPVAFMVCNPSDFHFSLKAPHFLSPIIFLGKIKKMTVS